MGAVSLAGKTHACQGGPVHFGSVAVVSGVISRGGRTYRGRAIAFLGGRQELLCLDTRGLDLALISIGSLVRVTFTLSPTVS